LIQRMRCIYKQTKTNNIMAEKIILKARIAGIDFAPVITSEAGISTAVWEAQPLTLKDDEVSVVEADPTESEVFSHENDSPEDYELTGTGLSCVGTFIKATIDQMADLLGGTVSGTGATTMYSHPGTKTMLNKAIRYRLKNGGAIIIPCAKGSVQFNAKFSADGLLKLPFKFKALVQTGYNVDLIIKDTVTV